MRAGIEGLLHDKMRPSRIPPLPASVHERTVAPTLDDPPDEATSAGTAGIRNLCVGIFYTWPENESGPPFSGRPARKWRLGGFTLPPGDGEANPAPAGQRRGSPTRPAPEQLVAPVRSCW